MPDKTIYIANAKQGIVPESLSIQGVISGDPIWFPEHELEDWVVRIGETHDIHGPYELQNV